MIKETLRVSVLALLLIIQVWQGKSSKCIHHQRNLFVFCHRLCLPFSFRQYLVWLLFKSHRSSNIDWTNRSSDMTVLSDRKAIFNLFFRDNRIPWPWAKFDKIHSLIKIQERLEISRRETDKSSTKSIWYPLQSNSIRSKWISDPVWEIEIRNNLWANIDASFDIGINTNQWLVFFCLNGHSWVHISFLDQWICCLKEDRRPAGRDIFNGVGSFCFFGSSRKFDWTITWSHLQANKKEPSRSVENDNAKESEEEKRLNNLDKQSFT